MRTSSGLFQIWYLVWGGFWGWQGYFTTQPSVSSFGYFGRRAAGLLLSSFRRSIPIGCEINTDLFAAPCLLIIQQLLPSHYTTWAIREHIPLISLPVL